MRFGRWKLLTLGFAIILAGAGFAARHCCAATVNVGRNVPAAQRVPLERIDHAAWNALLKKYVDAQGIVNYAAWKASDADTKALDAYLSELSAASFSTETPPKAKLAFWINAYNATTVKGILREYPTTSIRNHTAKVFGYNIWKDLQITIADRTYSLEQIEHEVLRKMGEPRIHFAIVCASIGCPPLRSEAYTAEKLDGQLTDNGRKFFAQRSKFQFDTQKKTVGLSPILSWFAEDFGDTQAKQLQRIAAYLPGDEAQRLAESGAASVSYLDYDWNLNDQSSVGQSQTR